MRLPRHGLRRVFLLGRPRSGKTTVIKSFLHLYPGRLWGFYTEEVCESGRRLGFDVVTTEGQRVPLARRGAPGPKVGPYGVDISALNEVVAPLLRQAPVKALLVIDELGKMELKSREFIGAVEAILASNRPLLATLGQGRLSHLKAWRQLPQSLYLLVDEFTRDGLPQRLVAEFERPGVLVALEGVDGSGKTTLARALAEHLIARGKDVVLTQEPTTGVYGQKLRQLLGEGRASAEELLFLFLKDRQEHVKETILPALWAGKIVITDRYYFSTLAYQGAQGFSLEDLTLINQAIAPCPDLVFVLHLPLEKVPLRIRHRQRLESFEKDQGFLHQVERIFSRIKGDYIVHLAASQSPDELLARVLAELKAGGIL